MGFNGPPMRDPKSIPEVKWTPARGETIKVPTLIGYSKGDIVGFAKDGTLSMADINTAANFSFAGVVVDVENKGGKIRVVSIATYVGVLIPVQYATKVTDTDKAVYDYSEESVPATNDSLSIKWEEVGLNGSPKQHTHTTTNSSGFYAIQNEPVIYATPPKSAKIEEPKPPEPIIKQVVEQRSARSIRV